MEIKLDASHYGYHIIIEAENVKITEDIESRTYHKTEKGMTDWMRAPERDITDEALNQFTQLLEDIIYYRKKDYDSSSLIENLFSKLPQQVANELYVKLNKYVEDENND